MERATPFRGQDYCRHQQEYRCAAARGDRDQDEAGMEDLLALSRRFRRAATIRFFELGKSEIRNSALPRPAPVYRRDWPTHCLQRECHLSARGIAPAARQAG